MNLLGIVLFSQLFFSSQRRVTGKEGCYTAEVVNRSINFGVINLYYVPFREVTAPELKKEKKNVILLSLAKHSANPARLNIFTQHPF